MYQIYVHGVIIVLVYYPFDVWNFCSNMPYFILDINNLCFLFLSILPEVDLICLLYTSDAADDPRVV